MLDNFSHGKRINLPLNHPQLEIVNGDICDLPTVDEALDGITHVLHLAAQVSVGSSFSNPINSANHNVLGFLHVLDSAKHHGVEKLVYASSASAYGNPDMLPIHESSEAKPISPYGLEKLMNDRYAELIMPTETLGLRYFNVYGPRQDPKSSYAGVITKLVNALYHNARMDIYGDGNQSRDFVYVKDVADINFHALQNNVTGICNVGTGSSVTILKLIEVLEQITERKLEKQFVQFYESKSGDIQDSRMDPYYLHSVFGDLTKTNLTEGLTALWKSYAER